MTAATRHFLGRAEFAAVKAGTIVVNTGRGPTIDNQALYEAILSGKISGAGLDDPEEEPAKRASWSAAQNPLFSLPNVLVTPHSAYYSEESIRLARETAAGEVARVLTGQTPRNPVNDVLPTASSPQAGNLEDRTCSKCTTTSNATLTCWRSSTPSLQPILHPASSPT